MKENTNQKKFKNHTIGFKNQLNKLSKATRHPVEKLFVEGKADKTILKELELSNGDFKGLYAFWKNDEAVYVGISKKVIKRLVQHIKGTTHHSATFPIKILKMDEENKYKIFARKDFKSHHLKPVQEKQIKKMYVSFIPVNDDITLYLFEVYCAVELNCRYNTFETH